MRLVDYVMKFLENNGVEASFVLTGNGAMYINDAIAKCKKIKYFTARHEAAAPMMAESYSRITNKPSMVCVTSGPGATNTVSGLAEAWVDSGKVIVLSGQAPTDQIPNKKIRSFGTAGIDIVPIVKPITKYAVTVKDPDDIRFHLEKAFYLMNSGRPGPVWIDLPMDVQYAEINPKKLKGFKLNLEQKKNIDLFKIDYLYDQLKHSKKPLFLIGHGVRQGGAIALLKKLLVKLKVPFAFSRLAQDFFPYSMEGNMGQVGRRGQRYSKRLLNEADLVISVGCRLSVPLAGSNLQHFNLNAFIAMVDVDQEELANNDGRLNLSINCDVKLFLKAFEKKINLISSSSWDSWIASCNKLKKSYPMFDIKEMQSKDPIDLYYFMSKLDFFAKKDSIMITDAGSNYYVGGQVFKFESGQREITSGAYAAMGLTIPLSIGAAIASKGSTVLAVTGDGSLELNVQDLKTISYYNFNIKLFVINNGGYVSMRNWQDNFFDGRRIGSDSETGAEMLNLRKVAEAFDIKYQLIKDPNNIDEDLKSLIKQKGAFFIEVITDPNQKIVQPYEENLLSS